MTPEAQRIAIAEECGWKSPSCNLLDIQVDKDGNLWTELPDYPNDLNAMHEAEKKLEFPEAYASRLGPILLRDGSSSNMDGTTAWNFAFSHATARQRAEAFLRTIGKWEE